MTSKNEPLRGKVARILNSRELVINIGEQEGVEIGMLFDVLNPKGEDIKDPDTGKTHGSIERPKVRVKIVTTQDKLSIAATYKQRKVNIGGSGPDIDLFGRGLASMLLPPKWVDKYETLKTDEKTLEDFSEEESYV